jgi:PAS domain S-box-containing protein
MTRPAAGEHQLDPSLLPFLRALAAQDWPGVAFLSLEGCYRYVSPRFAAMNGVSPDALIGKLVKDVAPDLWRQGARAFELSRQGEMATFELQAELEAGASGKVTWLVNVFPAYDHGALVGVVATVADITPMRSAEERELARLRQLAALANLNAQALAPTVTLHELLQSAVEIVADVLSLPVARIIRAVSGSSELVMVAGVGWEWDSRLAAGRAGSYVEYVMRTREPVRISDLRTESRFRVPEAVLASGGVSSMAVGLHATHGPWGILSAHANEQRVFNDDEASFMSDVATTISLALKAQEALEYQEQLLSIASHELRAPLTTVIGLSEHLARMLRRKGDAMPAELADEITAGGFQLNATIDRWLGLAAAERGGQAITREAMDLPAVVSQRVADMQTRHNGLRVHQSYPSAPLVIASDVGRVREIVDNLLENAARYAGAIAEVTITVESDGRHARVRVADNGPGIPLDQQRRIFERFYRGNGESTRGGLGIGLYVSRLLAEELGGTLAVASTPGEGAAFTLSLPLTS